MLLLVVRVMCFFHRFTNVTTHSFVFFFLLRFFMAGVVNDGDVTGITIIFRVNNAADDNAVPYDMAEVSYG